MSIIQHLADDMRLEHTNNDELEELINMILSII